MRSLEDHAEELRTRGYTIVEGVLDRAQIDAANTALEALFEIEKELGARRGWQNNVYKVVYMLPQKHKLFRSICLTPRVLSLMRMLLGENCVLGSLNGLSMTPGGENQALHIDQPESTPGLNLYINALHALDDFTRENGCTRVVPGSHNRIKTREMNLADFESEAIYLEAPAGSMIAYNGGLWHAGSRNATQRQRRALHPFFHRAWVQPQWDYRRSLTPDVVAELTPEQRQLFGFHAWPRWYDRATDEIKQEK